MLSPVRTQSRSGGFAATLNATFWRTFFDPTSLTLKLRAAASRGLRVECIRLAWCVPDVATQRSLGLTERNITWCRHVLLHVDDQVWVEARTWIPFATLQPAARHLLFLKERPLGDALFQDPQLQRSDLRLSWAANGLPLRESRFLYRDTPIYLHEVFQPVALEYFSRVAT